VQPSASIAKLTLLLALGCAWWFAGCATALGPGYIVVRQKIAVGFSAQPEPSIAIAAEYRLSNTGNQPLESLIVRLPGRRLRPQGTQIFWDDSSLTAAASPNNPRDTLLQFPGTWHIGETHTLEIRYEIPAFPARDTALGFSADAFYLPGEGWTPQLPQAPGVFGFGGVPPKQWELTVRVPQGFLVHASGKEKHFGKNADGEHLFIQMTDDLNPFVVAGQYGETQQQLAENRKVHIWTRSAPDTAQLRQSGEALSRTLASYDALFGTRGKTRPPLWIVECPAPAGCILRSETNYSALLYGRETSQSAQLISQDCVVVDSRESNDSLEASAGPALAAGWLGYGQNPGFYEQQLPMSALPAFASALAREASDPNVRGQIIRRALAEIPEHDKAGASEAQKVTRAKSLLLFYALRERVGQDAFHKALQHMLYARQRRGFNVTDLISALDQESHQDVASFVRQWIKRPGVPDEFRRRYASSDSKLELPIQETTQ
jgi:hypothetical protein